MAGDSLAVVPVVRATAAVRRASSSCCGAGLSIRPDATGTPDGPAYFACRACGQPCDRVLSDPEEVELHG